MIEELKHLRVLLDESEKAGPFKKAELAGKGAHVTFQLLRSMARRIIDLENKVKELEQCKQPAQSPTTK